MAEEDNNDDSQKTQDPSQKRIEEAYEKGQVIFSREVNNLFIFLILTMTVIWVLPGGATSTVGFAASFFNEFPQSEINKHLAGTYLTNSLKKSLEIIMVPCN